METQVAIEMHGEEHQHSHHHIEFTLALLLHALLAEDSFDSLQGQLRDSERRR